MSIYRLLERKEILEYRINDLEYEIICLKERLEHTDREIGTAQAIEEKENELAYQKMKL